MSYALSRHTYRKERAYKLFLATKQPKTHGLSLHVSLFNSPSARRRKLGDPLPPFLTLTFSVPFFIFIYFY